MNHQSESHRSDHPPCAGFVSFAFKFVEVFFVFVLFCFKHQSQHHLYSHFLGYIQSLKFSEMQVV